MLLYLKGCKHFCYSLFVSGPVGGDAAEVPTGGGVKHHLWRVIVGKFLFCFVTSSNGNFKVIVVCFLVSVLYIHVEANTRMICLKLDKNWVFVHLLANFCCTMSIFFLSLLFVTWILFHFFIGLNCIKVLKWKYISSVVFFFSIA